MWRKKTVVLGAFLLPLMMFTLLSLLLAFWQLQRDINLTAEILLRHADSVIEAARQTTRKTAALTRTSCGEASRRAIALEVLAPYVRSTGLIYQNMLVCSTLTGAKATPVRDIYDLTFPPGSGDEWIISLPGTRSIPDHPVVFYAVPVGAENVAFTVIDGQYISDLMDALAGTRHTSFALFFGEGAPLSHRHAAYATSRALTSRFHSSVSHATLMVNTPFLSLLNVFLRRLLFLVPASLLVSLLLLFAYRRWQRKKMSLADEIKKGIVNGEFRVHYQPVCETLTGRCHGVEALMRWQRAGGRQISPDIFISAAEQEGLIIPLTHHLFALIRRDVAGWDVHDGFHLGVNIAAAHLTHPDFPGDIASFCHAISGRFQPVLEITERSLVEDTSLASSHLLLLREKGIKIAIDDFGTGYCSLSALQSLPLDYLKIDKTFIDTLSSAQGDTPVLDTIINLSRRLGLVTIAEGVSTQRQVDYLIKEEVSYIQGYHYARPMAGPDFLQWYHRNLTMEALPVANCP